MAKCSVCNRKVNFFTEYRCTYCGKSLCSNCIIKVPFDEDIDDLLSRVDNDYKTPYQRLILRSYYLCKSCSKLYLQKYNAMKEAINNNPDVKTVSDNYQGNKFNNLHKTMELQTRYYKNKGDAENDIKSMAKYLGCTHVLEMSFDRDEDEERGPKGGIHYFSVWSASGYAAK